MKTSEITITEPIHRLYDYEDVAFAFDGTHYYPLTDCCQASGNGSCNAESGVVCRGCYEEYPSDWGAAFTTEEFERMQNA